MGSDARLLQRLGLKTTSEKYLADYMGEDFELPFHVTGYIEAMGRRKLPPRTKAEKGSKP